LCHISRENSRFKLLGDFSDLKSNIDQGDLVGRTVIVKVLAVDG
jgi:hypothetical protein